MSDRGDVKPGDLLPLAVQGMTFQVLLDTKGEEHVKVADLCAPFGLAVNSQRERVKGLVWARGTLIVSVRSSGKSAEFFCIPVRKVGMFFATLDPSRIKAEHREGLERFQDEISDAVHDYIAKGGAIRPGASVLQLEEIRDFVTKLLRDVPRTTPAWPDAFVKRYGAWNGFVWRTGDRHPFSMQSANWFFYTMIFPPEVLAIIKARGLEDGCRYHQVLEDKPHTYLRDQLDIATRIANDCGSEAAWRARMRLWYGKTAELIAGQGALDL